MNAEDIAAATKAWVEAVVIGLDLCPFAKPVHEAGRIRYAVSAASTPEALRQELVDELLKLKESDPATIETTLLVHPDVLGEFLEYNDFLDVADGVIRDLGLEGEFQVASFHPRYRFEGTGPDDVTNRTNQSPYPMLHLLREASVEKALQDHPDAHLIPERNIEKMRRLEPPTS